MREIKIRAWDDELKEMLYSKTEQFDDALMFRFNKHFETEKPIFMQSTGFKDRNGVEIFDGDIIWWGKDEPAPASNVIFDDGAFKVSDTRELLADVLNGAEVISNIHDSPDFLGVTP